ncbi:hypothetical protein C7999DRAFT_34830 [Corynascus novoguineensis]|uniref:Uncharacterized protein n=1 Tax=Corynascus novoguineensis TaxID=1126955 RepID=A0AAN7HGR9_9PEZI|nr:hypothetical protein C7999DRAFT_34830 [Corynascus novoguineensis]
MFRRFTSRSEASPETAMSEDEDEEPGFPAQLHQEYTPPPERRDTSKASYHGAAAVDIVLVHGLGSNYNTTWAHKRDDGSRYHWIRERLPKDIPDARILGFEYPSRWYDDPVTTSLTECASQLLRSLIQDRCHIEGPEMCRTRRTRPIIFVGHSFGGLVIKQAMVMASQVLSSNSPRIKYENHRDILSAIAGVVFLGTPHRGSSFAALAGLKISLGSHLLRVQANDEIITILKPDSYVLDELQRTFAQLCSDERMRDLKLICYYEMRVVPYLRKLVVSQSSASLDGAECHGMNANHMDMNAFYEGDQGRHDSNYGHFIADIRSVFQNAPPLVSKRFDNWVYGSDTPNADRERLQRWLDPSRDVQTITYTEKLDIQRAAPYTCQWIHNTKAFNDWKLGSETGNSTLWITGTAGSGKSVLAAYIINALKNGGQATHGHSESCSEPIAKPCGFRDRSVPVLMFFCGVDRKSESTDRMLATLVHQLLLSRPKSQELFDIAEEMYRETLKGDKAWSSTLAKYLAMMINVAGPVFIVIDNLEDIPQPALLLEKLSVLRKETNVHLLISSQETDQVARALDTHFDVRTPLCITDHSSEDIRQFTELHGTALMTAKPQLQEKKDFIMKTLHERAQGMFQWVNSALEQLESLVDPREVETELNSIQGNLTKSYDKIFERLLAGRDDAEERRIQIALKWIAASATPVTAVDVKIAYMIDEIMSRRDQNMNKGRMSPDTERRIQQLFDKEESREVAEREAKQYLGSIVNVRSDGTLQFKHPTFLRALATPDTIVTPASKLKFRLSDAHRDLAVTCMTVCQTTTYVHANSFISWRMPLVQYAWNFWAYHSNQAETGFTTAEDGAQLRSLLQVYPNMQGDLEKQQSFQTAFNKMIDGATRDAILYMEALIDFMSRPLRAVSGRFSDREYVLSLQRAQESLIQPTKDLCALRKSLFDPISSRLQHLAKAVKTAAEQPCPRSTPGTLQRKTADRVSGAMTNLLGLPPSSVTKLALDTYLESNPILPRPYGAPRLLIEIARNLRVTALRLAVDPIYSALLLTAGGRSFSPLHPLVYLAQLFEEAGRYPYWDTLPPGTDVMEPFICATEDPEFPSAKFVLHCFEWREPQRTKTDAAVPVPQTPTSTATAMSEFGGYYTRTAFVHIDMRPSPGTGQAIGLTRVSTENWEQVRRLHQAKAAHFYAAQETYALFRSSDDWLNRNIINPLANLHMRFSFAVEEHTDLSLYQEDAATVLNAYAPVEVREAPLKTFIIALPYMFRVYFVQYIVKLLECFGQVGIQVLTTHWTKIESALSELRGVGALWRRLLPGSWGRTTDHFGNEIPRVNPAYLVPAAALFYLRCLYFPAWGGYMWYHSWTKFHYAWHHPAAYLELQNQLSYGFWRCLWVVLIAFCNIMVGEMAVGMTRLPPNIANRWTRGIASTYALFYSMCTLTRTLFTIAAALATLSACGLVMLRDAETVAELFRFSFYFWFTVFVQLILGMVQLGVLEKGGGWIALLGGAVAQLTAIIICTYYYLPITRFFWACMKPARWMAVWIWMNWLQASVVAAKCIGMSCLALGVWRAYWYMHKFLWDPHDIEGSLKKLLEASNLARATLGANINSNNNNNNNGTSLGQLVVRNVTPGDFKRIGWYPLGEKRLESSSQYGEDHHHQQPPTIAVHGSSTPPRSARRLTPSSLTNQTPQPTASSASFLLTGPSRAETPLTKSTQSAQKDLSEGLGQAVVGLQQYLASDSGLKRDVERLGHAVDAAVLASGDGVGRAVDKVLSGAQEVGERAFEAASEKGLGGLRIVGRDLLLVGGGGKVKEE